MKIYSVAFNVCVENIFNFFFENIEKYVIDFLKIFIFKDKTFPNKVSSFPPSRQYKYKNLSSTSNFVYKFL